MPIIRLVPAALAVLLAISACRSERPLGVDTFTTQGLMSGSRSTRAACAGRDGVVWAELADGAGECLRYFASGLETDKNPIVLAFFHGDVGKVRIHPAEFVRPPSVYRFTPALLRAAVEKWAGEADIPVIFLSRPGVLGSTGYHGERLLMKNRRLLNAGLDALKRRHAISRWALAGNSGGGMVVASLLAMRGDIACAVLGSAAASLKELIYSANPNIPYGRLDSLIDDPFDQIDAIPRDEARTIIVIGDQGDEVVDFNSQRSFAIAVGQAGHKVIAVPLKAKDSRKHNMAGSAVAIAAACAKADHDDKARDMLRTLEENDLYRKKPGRG